MLSNIYILCAEILGTIAAADAGTLTVCICTTGVDQSARSARSVHATGRYLGRWPGSSTSSPAGPDAGDTRHRAAVSTCLYCPALEASGDFDVDDA